MVKGEWKNAYQCLSTGYQTTPQPYGQSYEEFVKACEANTTLADDYRNAYLKNISVESKEASARLIWSTGHESMIDFIEEGPNWKIVRMSRKIINPTQ